MYQAEAITPSPGVKPYAALALAGRDIYVREGCYNCHSQMIRTLRFETERYGHYSLAGESVSTTVRSSGAASAPGRTWRASADVIRDDWHRVHLINPRDVVPESNMPGFPWLAKNTIDADGTPAKMRALQTLGDPYSDAEIAGAVTKCRAKPNSTRWSPTCRALGKHAPEGLVMDIDTFRDW